MTGRSPLDDRMAVLAALAAVSLVVAFDEDTPLALIEQIRRIIGEGRNWTTDKIVGSDVVRGYGGEVHSIPFRFPHSTTICCAGSHG